MSDFAWKLKRLKAMEPREVILRVKRKFRDQFVPKKYLKEIPEETFSRLFRSISNTSFKNHLFERSTPKFFSGIKKISYNPKTDRSLIIEADEILKGNIRLWEQLIQVEFPINWNKNYFHGGEWPESSVSAMDYHQIGIAGGVKYTWELSRHGFLLKLAQAWNLTGDAKYAKGCLDALLNWIDTNPANRGIHWTSALEMAVRVINWSFILYLLEECIELDEAAVKKIVGSMAQQVCYIADNLSFGSSANNHLIGEASAILYFAVLFPECVYADNWHEIGKKILDKEILRQIHEDGVPAEQAFGYLTFVWEFYLYPFGLMKQNGADVSEAIKHRLEESLNFVSAAMDSAGNIFQVGDEDDGEVVPLSAYPSNRYSRVGRAIAKLIECNPIKKVHEQDDAYCRWLWGQYPSKPSMGRWGAENFSKGGYIFFRNKEREIVGMFDFGELGLGSIAAHGHADALQFCLSVKGKPMLIDPGTYAYHEDPRWRDYFRSTSAHNTLTVAEENQSEISGPFLWGSRVSPVLNKFISNEAVDFVSAAYKSLDDNKVERTVLFIKPDLFIIQDCLEKESTKQYELNFTLSPECELWSDDEEQWFIRNGEAAIAILCSGMNTSTSSASSFAAINPKVTKAYSSPIFGTKVETNKLTYSFKHYPGKVIYTAISIGEQLQLRNYGFEAGGKIILLSGGDEWEFEGTAAVIEMNESGTPASLCGIDVTKIVYKKRTIYSSSNPQSLSWQNI